MICEQKNGGLFALLVLKQFSTLDFVVLPEVPFQPEVVLIFICFLVSIDELVIRIRFFVLVFWITDGSVSNAWAIRKGVIQIMVKVDGDETGRSRESERFVQKWTVFEPKLSTLHLS